MPARHSLRTSRFIRKAAHLWGHPPIARAVHPSRRTSAHGPCGPTWLSPPHHLLSLGQLDPSLLGTAGDTEAQGACWVPQGSTTLGLELWRQPPARALLCPSAALAQSTRIRTPGPQPRALLRDGREGAHVPEGREKELGARGLSCPDPGQRAVGSTLNTHSAPKVPSPLTCRPWAGRRADTARWAIQALIPQQPPNLRNKKQERGGPQGSARSWRTAGAPQTPLGIRPPVGEGGRAAVAPDTTAAGALRPLPAQGPPSSTQSHPTGGPAPSSSQS